jgi:FtsP/CotA-like multicopper oxidase with cupredoxin domain
MWWSINGHIYPNVPMFVVSEGDVALVHIENRGGEVHPMHLHGHHMVDWLAMGGGDREPVVGGLTEGGRQ